MKVQINNRINEILLLAYLSLLQVANASLADFNETPAKSLQNFKCYQQAQKLMDKWQVTGEWTRHFDGEKGDLKLVSPTRTFAKWFEIKLGEKPSVHLISPQRILNVAYDGNCHATTTMNARIVKLDDRKFNDRELAQLIERNKTGLIYAWSPHMPLSIDGINEIKQAAAKLNLPVTFVLSPHANMEFAKKVLNEKKLPAEYLKVYDSLEMVERGSSLHFPSLLIYQNGKLFRRARPGHEVSKIFETYLKKVMSL